MKIPNTVAQTDVILTLWRISSDWRANVNTQEMIKQQLNGYLCRILSWCSGCREIGSVYLAFSECYQSIVKTHYFKGQSVYTYTCYLLFSQFPLFFLKEGVFDSKVPDSLSISESPDFIWNKSHLNQGIHSFPT